MSLLVGPIRTEELVGIVCDEGFLIDAQLIMLTAETLLPGLERTTTSDVPDDECDR